MFKIGADPEMFLRDASNALISSIGKIGGSKENPLPLPIGDGFAVQEDNVAVEYNIPPAASKEELKSNIQRVLKYLTEDLGKKGLHITRESALSFPMSELLDPAAMVFGCDPDFNAWEKGAINPRPRAADISLRSCGGHIHIGYTFKDRQEVQQFIKHMDLWLGVPSAKMDEGLLRKQLYGKWGAFRYKPFGCEYRVLSNYWTFEDRLVEWVWSATDKAMDSWLNKTIDVDSDRDAISASINHSNKDAVEYLSRKYNLLYA